MLGLFFFLNDNKNTLLFHVSMYIYDNKNTRLVPFIDEQDTKILITGTYKLWNLLVLFLFINACGRQYNE